MTMRSEKLDLFSMPNWPMITTGPRTEVSVRVYASLSSLLCWGARLCPVCVFCFLSELERAWQNMPIQISRIQLDLQRGIESMNSAVGQIVCLTIELSRWPTHNRNNTRSFAMHRKLHQYCIGNWLLISLLRAAPFTLLSVQVGCNCIFLRS